MFSVLRMDFKIVGGKPDVEPSIVSTWSTEGLAKMSRDIFESTTPKYNSWDSDELGFPQTWPTFEVIAI